MKYYIKDSKEIMSMISLDSTYKELISLTFEHEVYYLYEDASVEALGIHLIEDERFLETHKETLEGKLSNELNGPYKEIIEKRKLIGINLKKLPFNHDKQIKSKYRVHVLGLGDVGGMMLSALRLIGGNIIEAIGIFDLDDNRIKRWCYELNQIMTIDRGPFPEVYGITMENLFDCDVFIFTASSRIPEVGSGITDVRMYQLEANTKIVSIYAKKAKEVDYKGQFIVVSDPVDLLCKAALVHSDLRPEQIKGFGLGVMQARANYYANKNGMTYYYEQGRAFGPHGKHLVIADSMIGYSEENSLKLTEMTVKANLEVRAVGYKPFIAPALSSAAMSILAYLEGKWHYSTVYIDGVYFGCKHKCIGLDRTITEQYTLDSMLLSRLESSYKELKSFEF